MLVTLLSVSCLGALPAAAAEQAPRRPPQPFTVFVKASDPADAALRTRLEEAMPMVRERVERRRRWFQLAETPEAADITLRLTNYRTGQYRNPMQDGPYGEGMQGREFHFLDAVVQGGGVSSLWRNPRGVRWAMHPA